MPTSFVQAQGASSQPTGNTPPILSTVPLATSNPVRPDTPLTWQLDTTNQHFKDWNAKLLNHEFNLELINDGGAAVFTGDDAEFSYDSSHGLLSFTPPTALNRYTTYDAVLTFDKADAASLQDPNRKKLPDEPPAKVAPESISALNATATPTTGNSTTTTSTSVAAKPLPSSLSLSGTALDNLQQLQSITQQQLSNMQTPAQSEWVGPQPVTATNGSLHPIDVKDGQQQKGYIEQINQSVVTLFGGRQFTVTPSTHIHLEDAPDARTLQDLHPGDFVIVTLDANSTVQNINVKNNDDAYSLVFTTGSALHEPTHVSVVQKENNPRVTENGQFTLVSTDDYGLPAWGSDTQIDLATTDGSALNPSAKVLPAYSLTTNSTDGNTEIDVVDHAPQALVAKVSMNGPYQDGRDAQGFAVFFNFRPGLPATATLVAPSTMEVATVADLTGQVQDIYGNPVEDGTLLNFQSTAGTIGSSITTINGVYHTGYTAPTKVQDVTVSLASAEGNATASSTIHLLPGAPAIMTLPAPTTLPAGTETTLQGNVTDQYGNAVLDGTQLEFTTSSGTIDSQVTTTAGSYDVQFTAPTKVQTVTVSGASVLGTANASATMQVVPGSPAQLSLQAQQNNLHTGDQTQISGLVSDQYGNLISNQEVDLQTLYGTLSNGKPSTDPTGWFTSTYTAPFTNGVDTVTGQAGDAKASLDLNISSEGFGYNPTTGQVEPVSKITFDQSGYTVAPGQAITLTFHAYDANGQPLQGVVFTMTDSSGGTVHAVSSQTDATGASQITYQAPTTPGSTTLTVSSSNVTTQTTITVASYGMGYDPTTQQWLPVGSVSFPNSNPQVAPGQTASFTGQVLSTTGVPLTNVQFDQLSMTGGQATLPAPTDSTGSFTFAYTAPTTLGTQVVQLGSGNVSVTLNVNVSHDNMGFDPTTGNWVPVASIVFTPAQYSVLTGSSVELTGTVSDANGHPLSLAKLLVSFDGGNITSQVVSKSDGTFSMLYAAPNTPGTYHVTASTSSASGTAVINVAVPSAPHMQNSSISLTGSGSGNLWTGNLSWQTTVLNADGSPAPDLLFVLDDGYMNFLDYNYTDSTGTVGDSPFRFVTNSSYTGYSNGKLIHYATITMRISNFDIVQWAYLQPSYTKTFNLSW